MTKEELRTQYVSEGWEVVPVANWALVSSIEGKNKYDVNVVSPSDQFGTAQVVVVDDDGAGETATAEGFWKDTEASFAIEVRMYANSLETGAVFAVSIANLFESDAVAVANVYFNDGSQKTFVVKKRGETFSHQELV